MWEGRRCWRDSARDVSRISPFLPARYSLAVRDQPLPLLWMFPKARPSPDWENQPSIWVRWMWWAGRGQVLEWERSIQIQMVWNEAQKSSPTTHKLLKWFWCTTKFENNYREFIAHILETHIKSVSLPLHIESIISPWILYYVGSYLMSKGIGSS